MGNIIKITLAINIAIIGHIDAAINVLVLEVIEQEHSIAIQDWRNLGLKAFLILLNESEVKRIGS